MSLKPTIQHISEVLDDVEQRIHEDQEERAAIRQFDGLMTRAEAERLTMLDSEEYRFACEVRTVLRLTLPERRQYLELVEKKRGKGACDRLKTAITQEWTRMKAREKEEAKGLEMAIEAVK